jgi:hypothetical protein
MQTIPAHWFPALKISSDSLCRQQQSDRSSKSGIHSNGEDWIRRRSMFIVFWRVNIGSAAGKAVI